MKHTISVLVENQAGVLSKVVGLFSRRAFNIESLAVGETEDPTISRITIIVEGTDYTVEQVEKQLNKIIPVIKVKTLVPGTFYSRMLTLFKVVAPAARRPEIIQIAELMGAKILDVGRETVTLEFTDTQERTDTLESLLRPFGLREVVRTGCIAIEAGDILTRRPLNGPKVTQED